jgi:hypothetical protein
MNDQTTENKEYKKKPYFNIYKPLRKDGMGAALQFSYDNFKRGIFLEAARQKGAKLEIGSKEQFDWDGKIVFKIGVADIGRMLMLFARQEKSIKCLHSQQGTGRTSVLEITQGEYEGRVNFKLDLSRTADGKTTRVGMFISAEEMALLAAFVRASLERMLGFE